MDNNISVEGRLGGVDETTTNPSEEANQGSLTANTVTLKPTNSYLPQTNSHEALPLSLIGFIMCASIMIGYGVSVITRKKAIRLNFGK